LPFQLLYTHEANSQLDKLGKNKNLQKRSKAVDKASRLLGEEPNYTGLNAHKYSSLKGPDGCEVFEAYAENKTPAAYRIFWCYYPPKEKGATMGNITILAITTHP